MDCTLNQKYRSANLHFVSWPSILFPRLVETEPYFASLVGLFQFSVLRFVNEPYDRVIRRGAFFSLTWKYFLVLVEDKFLCYYLKMYISICFILFTNSINLLLYNYSSFILIFNFCQRQVIVIVILLCIIYSTIKIFLSDLVFRNVEHLIIIGISHINESPS